MSASEDDTEKILEEFYWLKQNLLKVNNEHDEIMDHCKNCIKIIERNSKNIKEQIQANKRKLSKIEKILKYEDTLLNETIQEWAKTRCNSIEKEGQQRKLKKTVRFRLNVKFNSDVKVCEYYDTEYEFKVKTKAKSKCSRFFLRLLNRFQKFENMNGRVLQDPTFTTVPLNGY